MKIHVCSFPDQRPQTQRPPAPNQQLATLTHQEEEGSSSSLPLNFWEEGKIAVWASPQPQGE